MPPETHYAPCGELSIAYQVIGKGPRDLLIVPGFLWPIRYTPKQEVKRILTNRAGTVEYCPTTT
jgi:hypothetical protein